MNRKLKDFCAEQGLTVNGNKAYGTIKGYEVNAIVVLRDTVAPFRLHFSFYATDEQKRSMEAALRNATIKFCRYNFTPYGLMIALNDLTIGRLVKRLPELMELFFGIISGNGGLTSEYCPICGQPFGENKKSCAVDGMTVTIDTDCLEKLNAVIAAENKQFNEAPNNYLYGFFGALLGGLAGTAIAIGLYMLGFYSAIASAVAIALGVVLYKKFHGKPNKIMIVIVSATTLVCMVLSVFLIYFAAAGMAAHNQGLDISAMEAFRIVMQDQEVSRAFTVDMVMVLLFAAIGIGVQIYYLARSIKRKETIQ